MSNSRERQGQALGAGPFEFVMGAFKEVPAVAAAGQHIGGGQALQFEFQVLFR